MLIFVIIYIGILLTIGIIDARKVKNFDDFAVAGRRQSQTFVTLSLLATMIGASATMGVMGRVSSLGFPAFWWLGVGSVGLLLQALLLSERVRELDANTVPDLVTKLLGRIPASIVAIIIIVAWPGIVASQILAMSSIFSLVTGAKNTKTLMLIVAIIVIAYTTIGGQLSVIKTDALQFIIIGAAFVISFVYLFFFANGDTQTVTSNIELLNNNYGVKELLIQLFIVGGTYLLGPDVISRNLVAKDGKTAKRSAIIAAIVLLFFNIIIILTGMYIISNYTDMGDMNPLIYIIKNILPKPIAVLLAIGLLSTLLSSADTCLVNISSIIENDVFRKNRVWALRLWAVLIGIIALFIAFFKGDIIAMLTGAYSVYAPGIVCPLFIAIMFHKKTSINVPLWIIASLAGGICGGLNTYIFTDLIYLPIIGMALSLIFSLLSVVFGSKIDIINDSDSE